MGGFWIALIVLGLGVVAGLAFAIVRGLRLWRQFKRTSGSLAQETERISAATASIADQLERASASADELKAASERLARSRAALDIQLAAFREARQAVKRAFWFVPGV
jgi:methyl-accepting chemotaxis protein